MKKLTVKPLQQKHAGRTMAAIDRTVMKELGIDNGDYVRISNVNDDDISTVARAWLGYESDDGKGVIRIDGEIREQCKTGINEKVQIELADIDSADSITVAVPDEFGIRGNFEQIVQRKLNGKPVSKDQRIPLSIGFSLTSGRSQQDIPLKIISTNPSDTVVVTDSTEINIQEQRRTSLDESDKQALNVNYEDIGGLDRELEQVREMIELPLRHPELFKQLGITPPKGVLLHGPPGTGKTLIAKAVANEVNAEFFTISGPEIMSKYYGESEEQLRETFDEASESSPAIIFMDELDSIASKREESSGDVERRVVAQLLSLMDGLEERNEVIVMGATNRVDAIDPALRRGGRFDREIEVGVPDMEGRRQIFDVHTRDMPISQEVDLDEYSERTHGFVGADIEALCKESAMTALRRIKPDLNLEKDTISAEDLEKITVTEEDFNNALKDIEPSALREVFVEVPDITWNDVGGLEATKERMREIIQWPLTYEDVFEDMNLDAAKGILMYGPPGTGKTLMAKAVANESDSNFISIKGPELLNKYVGESEKGIREVFEKARSNAPTIVFFDEIDAIAGERGRGMGDSGVGERVVSQLLTELDGLEQLEDVVVIATTNRPDLIDSALLRPGRLDRHIHVPVPDIEGRERILQVHTANSPISDNVDIRTVAEQADGFVGADLEALVREATMAATRQLIDGLDPQSEEHETTKMEIEMKHFEYALDEITPSVTEETEEEYAQIEEQFEKNSRIQADDDNKPVGFQ